MSFDMHMHWHAHKHEHASWQIWNINRDEDLQVRIKWCWPCYPFITLYVYIFISLIYVHLYQYICIYIHKYIHIYIYTGHQFVSLSCRSPSGTGSGTTCIPTIPGMSNHTLRDLRSQMFLFWTKMSRTMWIRSVMSVSHHHLVFRSSQMTSIYQKKWSPNVLWKWWNIVACLKECRCSQCQSIRWH